MMYIPNNSGAIRTSRRVLQYLCVWLSVCYVISGDDLTTYLYLNSHLSCDSDNTWPVNRTSLYKIRPDVSPETESATFMECEITFHSQDADGRLCISQDYFHTNIMDPNVKLVAKDGVGNRDDPTMFELDYTMGAVRGKLWEQGEKCSTSRYINVHLYRKRRDLPADIRKVFATLQVVDMRSHLRRLYMDRGFCNAEKFILSDSTVSVYNRRKPQNISVKPRDEPYELSSLCAFGVTKEPVRGNRSICMVYIPQGKPDCSTNWKILVLKKKWDMSMENQLYSLSCGEARSQQMQAWCADVGTNYVMLLHHRDMKGPTIWSNLTSPERPGIYRLILKDFPGGNVPELLRFVSRMLPQKGGGDDDSILSGFNMWYVAAIVGGGIVLLVIVALIVRSKNSDRGRGSRRASDAGTLSIPPDEDRVINIEQSMILRPNGNGIEETISLNG